MVSQTINDLFAHAVERYKKPAALMYKRAGKYHSISSLDFCNKVRQASAGLIQLGIKKGDRVGLLSENRPEWAISDFAILAVGAINVPIYPTLPGAQIEYILTDAGVRIVILSTAQQLRKILQIINRVPPLIRIILMDPAEEHDARILGFEDFLSFGRNGLKEDASLYEVYHKKVEAHDLASIIYTSGTTGTPKGVMLSHNNIVSNVLACAEVLPINDSDIALSFLPLSHIFERTADYLKIYNGATIAYAESIETVPQNMLEVRPTVVASVPRLFEKMYARIMEAINASPPSKKKVAHWALGVGKEYSRYLLGRTDVPAGLRFKYRLASKLVFCKLRQKLGGRLRYFISGGAPLDKGLAEFFFSVGILILEGYGLTETSPVIAVNRPDDFKFGTVGKPLPNIEVKIAEDGEILTRSPSVMVGYYKKEHETKEALEDGWFHTGDIGTLDEEGFLRITDRKKDLIVTAGGKNVAPQKIEGLLKTNPYFLNVVAIGDKRPFVSALVVPHPDRITSYAKEKGLHFSSYRELIQSSEINDFLLQQIHRCSENLAPFEQIRRIVLLERDFSIESGELTPTMKVRRRTVESKYRDLIDRIYTKPYQPA